MINEYLSYHNEDTHIQWEWFILKNQIELADLMKILMHFILKNYINSVS